MTGSLWSRAPKLEPTGNATFHWSTGIPHSDLPPDPNITAHWTTEKIIYLTYFLTVPIAAIIFLIWVHIRWPKKPVRTKTEVPSQTIEVDRGAEGAEAENGKKINRMDSGNLVLTNLREPLMADLRKLESGEIREKRMIDLEDKSREEDLRGDDDLEIHVIGPK